MKLYCERCGKFVGDMAGQRRIGTVQVCKDCWSALQAADAVARRVRKEAGKMPEFFNGLF